MAIVGYLMNGDDIESQITLNLPTGKASTEVAIYTTLFIPITRYALMQTPLANGVESGLLENYKNWTPVRLLIRMRELNIGARAPFSHKHKISVLSLSHTHSSLTYRTVTTKPHPRLTTPPLHVAPPQPQITTDTAANNRFVSRFLSLSDLVIRPLVEQDSQSLQQLLLEIPIWVKNPDIDRLAFPNQKIVQTFLLQGGIIQMTNYVIQIILQFSENFFLVESIFIFHRKCWKILHTSPTLCQILTNCFAHFMRILALLVYVVNQYKGFLLHFGFIAPLSYKILVLYPYLVTLS
ncbi:uncharacterized protein LOC114294254 [Camellia sinensis]|uniref:uncharacterized protein LOC114294254 n=1 Tax=Camellia sinensis TaxID=4442 RepID=UPI001035FB1F|nr:uncharacterized protein LOC114294254 [Camellia sinensis]